MRLIARLLLLSLSTAACTTATTALSELREDELIRVAVCVAGPAPSLSFTLQNVSRRAILIDTASLPWVWWYGSKIYVTDAVTGETVERLFPIEDPPPPTVVRLAPGDQLTGHIALESYFPSLFAVNKTRAIKLGVALNIKAENDLSTSLHAAVAIPVAFFDQRKAECVTLSARNQ
jgi:hypothetical protein